MKRLTINIPDKAKEAIEAAIIIHQGSEISSILQALREEIRKAENKEANRAWVPRDL